MQTYTISAGTTSNGISVSSGTIVLGSPGRGSKEVRVPVPPGATVTDGQLMDLPGRPGEENAVVVLIKDHSGYRGGWAIRAARPESEWDTIVRRAVAHRPPDGTGALQTGHALDGDCAACAGLGVVPLPSPAQWRVIAEGYSAQGAAGRMGGGPEYLAVLLDGQSVEIVRSGRLYGSPTVFRVENTVGTVRVTDPRKEAESRAASSAW